LNASFNKAVSTRWSRVQRDITKYNAQYGGGNWGGRWRGWNSWNSIDLNGDGNANWFGNGIQEILEDFDREDGESLSQLNFELPLSDYLSIGDFEEDIRLVTRRRASSTPSQLNFLFDQGRGFGGGGFRGGLIGSDGVSMLPSLSSRLVADQPFFLPPGNDRGELALMWRQSKQLPASVFIAASQSPAKNQPGLAAVLAADHLYTRLAELKSLTVPDKRQLGEKKAIEFAISKMERVGASVESSGMFC
jgi:hypothetical protein